MNPSDIVRQIGADINAAEAAITHADALATDEFRALFDAGKIAKVEADTAKARKSLDRLHKSLNAALATATFPMPRTGK